MKNPSLILNIVLLVAVGILYFLHFSSSPSGSSLNPLSAGVSDVRIAYINTDSILDNYDYLKVKKKELEDKSKKYDEDLRGRAQSLQREYESYQRNVGSFTLSQVKAVEEDLTNKQQNLRMHEQTLTQELMAEQNKLQQELYERLTDYLKDYGRKNGLQFVLKYDVTSDVLYAGDSLDITNTVLTGLNQDYKDEKNGVMKDSTKNSTTK